MAADFMAAGDLAVADFTPAGASKVEEATTLPVAGVLSAAIAAVVTSVGVAIMAAVDITGAAMAMVMYGVGDVGATRIGTAMDGALGLVGRTGDGAIRMATAIGAHLMATILIRTPIPTAIRTIIRAPITGTEATLRLPIPTHNTRAIPGILRGLHRVPDLRATHRMGPMIRRTRRLLPSTE